ncbi:MAG: SGNH/GDSL hydrolase family protein [Muribaculaceae bacterium]|nr:SGNH/GDSL hydrolase family protein [Muribaculaceae bacterium]
MCKHYGVTCVDLHDIDKQKSHPSIKGMTSIAEQVVNALKTLRSK